MKKFLSVATFAALCCMGLMTTTTMTSCSDDDSTDLGPSADEQLASKVNFDGLKAIAQANGTIKIEGVITSDKKLKEFEVIDENDKILATLGDKNTVTKEKEEDENGKKVKVFTMTVTSDPIPVQIMKFRIKAGVKKPMVSDPIGAKYNFPCGAGSKSSLGSYVSFVNEKSYSSSEVKTMKDKVIDLVCLDNKTFQVPSAANYQYDCFSKSAIYDSSSKNVKEAPNGTIVTETGCIATFETSQASSGENDLIISGVVITSKGLLKIDTGNCKSDMAK